MSRTLKEAEPVFAKGCEERLFGVLPHQLQEQYRDCLDANDERCKIVESDFWRAVRTYFDIPGDVKLTLRRGWEVVETMFGQVE